MIFRLLAYNNPLEKLILKIRKYELLLYLQSINKDIGFAPYWKEKSGYS